LKIYTENIFKYLNYYFWSFFFYLEAFYRLKKYFLLIFFFLSDLNISFYILFLVLFLTINKSVVYFINIVKYIYLIEFKISAVFYKLMCLLIFLHYFLFLYDLKTTIKWAILLIFSAHMTGRSRFFILVLILLFHWED